jgi:hypothetical protein
MPRAAPGPLSPREQRQTRASCPAGYGAGSRNPETEQMANSRKLLAASLGAALLALPLALSSPASAWERGGRAFEGGLRSNTSYGRWGSASNMGFNRSYDRRDFGRDRWGYGGVRSTWGYGRASMRPGWGYNRWGYGGRGNWGMAALATPAAAGAMAAGAMAAPRRRACWAAPRSARRQAILMALTATAVTGPMARRRRLPAAAITAPPPRRPMDMAAASRRPAGETAATAGDRADDRR